jgi:hypothetical protein
VQRQRALFDADQSREPMDNPERAAVGGRH